MESGAVGLVLSYALTLIGMFQWGARQSAEVENMVRSPNMLGSLLTWYVSPNMLGSLLTVRSLLTWYSLS